MDARTTPAGASAANGKEAIIKVQDIVVGFGDRIILNHLDLDVYRGEILGFVGTSGGGKSVLTRTILGLVPKRSGVVEVFGENLDDLSESQRSAVERRWGVLFQQGALFSSLTVQQNVAIPLREHMHLPETLSDELARLKIEMAGLPADACGKYPSELSGGMIKRAALARALALDPDLVFLDEPTAGLDPIGAAEFDQLILRLRETLGLTVFMVTHDLDSLVTITDRIAVLGNRRVLVDGTFAELKSFDDPWVRSYFNGPRAAHFTFD